MINYDRRGRGDSGEAGPVSVQHEVEDIAALIGPVAGRASLCGFSCGALALRAAGADIGVERRALDDLRTAGLLTEGLQSTRLFDHGSRRTSGDHKVMRRELRCPGMRRPGQTRHRSVRTRN